MLNTHKFSEIKEFCLKDAKEVLDNGIIETVPLSGHALYNIPVFKSFLVLSHLILVWIILASGFKTSSASSSMSPTRSKEGET